MSELILYTTEDGQSRIQLRAKRGTVWLSQCQMADLFNVSVDNISLHLKNIYQDGEFVREATTEKSSIVQKEGKSRVQRQLALYNFDAILAVGYLVRFPRGEQFHRWTSTKLKEYLQKRFVMDDEHRNHQEAIAEAVLKALEDKLKHRRGDSGAAP